MTYCVPVFYLMDVVILWSTGNVRGIGDTEIATHLILEQQAKGKRYLFWLAQSPAQTMVRYGMKINRIKYYSKSFYNNVTLRLRKRLPVCFLFGCVCLFVCFVWYGYFIWPEICFSSRLIKDLLKSKLGCDSTIAASKDTKKGYSPCALVSPGSWQGSYLQIKLDEVRMNLRRTFMTPDQLESNRSIMTYHWVKFTLTHKNRQKISQWMLKS